MFLAASVATRRAPLKQHRGARRRIPARKNGRFVDAILLQGLDFIASSCAVPDASEEADASTFAAFWSARARRCFFEPSLAGEDDAAEDSDSGGCCGGFKDVAAPEAPARFSGIGDSAVIADSDHDSIDEVLARSFDKLLQARCLRGSGEERHCVVRRHPSGFSTRAAPEPSLALCCSDSEDDDVSQSMLVSDAEQGPLWTDCLPPFEAEELDAYLLSSKEILARACKSRGASQDAIFRMGPVRHGAAKQSDWVGPGPSLTCDAASLCTDDVPASLILQASDMSEIPSRFDHLDARLSKSFTILSQTTDPGPLPSLDLLDSDSDGGFPDEMEDEEFYKDIDAWSHSWDDGGAEQ